MAYLILAAARAARPGSGRARFLGDDPGEGFGGFLRGVGPAALQTRALGLMLAAIAVITAAAAGAWWWSRRRRGRPAPTLAVAIVAGTVGAMAMVPIGLVLLFGAGAEVNVYGELLAESLFGASFPSILFAEHLVVGWLGALPLGLILTRIRRAPQVAVGAAYGAAMWLVLNSLALPWVFGRPTPWQLGFDAIWPSLLVHVVYGVVTALVWRRSGPRPDGDQTSRVRSSTPAPTTAANT